MKLNRISKKKAISWLTIFLLFILKPVISATNEAIAQTCVHPPTGAVGWWSGDGIANDLVDGNHGSLQNGATFTVGIVGQSFNLDGVDDYVDIGQLPQLQGAQEITVMGWINKFNSGTWPAFISKWDTTPYTRNNVFILGSGDYNYTNMGLFALNFADNTGAVVGGNSLIPTNEWVHIAATWRSSDGYMAIYKNGVLDNSAIAGVGKKLKYHTAYTAKIGEWGVVRDARYKLNGSIDEVAIFNRALSASEIQAVFNAGSAGMCKQFDTATIFTEKWENPAVAGSTSSTTLPPAWLSFSGPVDSMQIWHPEGTANFNQAAPLAAPAGGNQILFLSGVNTGIYRMSGVLIQPNTTYTLAAAIGHDQMTAHPEHWNLQLWADNNDSGAFEGLAGGDSFIGQQFGLTTTAVNPSPGEWALNTFSFNSSTTPDLVGKQLVVILANSDNGTSFFDNISLSARFSIEYQAPADPIQEYFSVLSCCGPFQVNEPIANDLGYPAWSISGLAQSSQFIYSSGALTSAQKADLTTKGFTLTLRGRVLQGNAPAYDAGANTVIGFGFLDTGSRRYDLALGVNSSGNTVAVLVTNHDTLGPGGSIRGFGPSYTLNDAGYHTYELAFDPQTQSASLFIDGTRRISGYTGHTNYLADMGLAFGATSGGGMNFNLVWLESPVVQVIGACGSADGQSSLTAPDENLCSAGMASAITGTGPWHWTCTGLNDGGTASCSAQLKADPLFSGFDSSREGWTTIGATAPVFSATGGNPGGYIYATDASGNPSFGNFGWGFFSPDAWDGNWSNYANGTVQFDLRPVGYNQTGTVLAIRSESNYMYTLVSGAMANGTWTHFETKLTDENFVKVGATFSQILQNVTALYINGDLLNGSETTALDNVRVDVSPIDGICGSADGQSFLTAPDENLCAAGTASEVTGAGPWNWTCTGSYGGTTVSCSAGLEGSTNLIAHWAFDETGGLTAFDGVGGVNGELVGGVTFTTTGGVIGGAIQITDGFVNMGNNFPASSAYSIQAWVKTDPGDTSGMVPVAKHWGGIRQGYFLAINDIRDGFTQTNTVGFYSANGPYITAVGGPSVNDGLWHQLVGVYDNGATSIYVDGNLAGTGSAGYANNNADFMIGGLFDNYGNPVNAFHGFIDEVQVYDKVLSGVDVKTLYDNTLNQTPDGACSPASGQGFLSAPTSNLCSSGTASAVTGTGPWSWTCFGSPSGTNASCEAYLQVNGTCGSADGQSFLTAPDENLCFAGAASEVTGPGPWNWTCTGSYGGTTASCSASLDIVPIDGECGSANGQNLYSAPSSGLCNAGTASGVNGGGPWTWTCTGADGGDTADCSAYLSVNGVCGSADGQSFLAAPAENLCNAGSASLVTGAGPWYWTCIGLNDGSTASCAAELEAGPVDGVCGSANGQSFPSAPGANLCLAGTASTVAGEGPWNWSCMGMNGGVSAGCSALLTFGGELLIAPHFEFSLEQDLPALETIQLTNPSAGELSTTVEIINPHPGLLISLVESMPVTIGASEINDLTLNLDSESIPLGTYDGILLKVAVEGGSVVYATVTVHITASGAAALPDLFIGSQDISFVTNADGSVTLAANIHNGGDSPAGDVKVSFYELDVLQGDAVITEVAAKGVGYVSLTTFLTAGDHLIRVVVDPLEEVQELSTENNEASRIIRVAGSPAPSAGNILVTGSLPSALYAGHLFNLSGHAVYYLVVNETICTDYVVKGGAVKISAEGYGGAWSAYSDIHTDLNGNFNRWLQAPTSPGTYRISMSVTDQTFIGRRDLVVNVIPAPLPGDPPAPPPPPPAHWGTGSWVPSGSSADAWNWVWTAPPSVPIPAADLRVFSEDIHFSNNNPAEGEEITTLAEIRYWATSTALVAQNVPVNIHVTYPGNPKIKVGQTAIKSIAMGSPDFGSRYVYASWKNQGQGIYIVEIEIDPSFLEANMLNNAATRAIIVGQGQGGLSVISGQVTDPLGGIGEVMIHVVDSGGFEVGNAITDQLGFYMVDNLPVGTLQVYIDTPDGYLADPDVKTVTTVAGQVSIVDFLLTVQAAQPVDGVCGSADGQSLLTAPVAGLCDAGIASAVTGTGPWSWTCSGSDGGATAGCSATAKCDLNADGIIDRSDINTIMSGRGLNLPGDPRDIDGDGWIAVNDGRACVLQCTNPNCVP